MLVRIVVCFHFMPRAEHAVRYVASRNVVNGLPMPPAFIITNVLRQQPIAEVPAGSEP
jgi:hypothetical protein